MPFPNVGGKHKNGGVLKRKKKSKEVHMGPYRRMSDFNKAFYALKKKYPKYFYVDAKDIFLKPFVVDKVTENDSPPTWAAKFIAGIRKT